MHFKKLLREINECGEDTVAPDPVAMERIPGGLGHRADPADFDQIQLMNGMHVELEHGSDVVTAMEIAMDHLSEDPNYYIKLKTMEKPQKQSGYFTDLEDKLSPCQSVSAQPTEAFTIDNDTDDDVKDIRGQNAEKTGTFNLSTMKLRK